MVENIALNAVRKLLRSAWDETGDKDAMIQRAKSQFDSTHYDAVIAWGLDGLSREIILRRPNRLLRRELSNASSSQNGHARTPEEDDQIIEAARVQGRTQAIVTPGRVRALQAEGRGWLRYRLSRDLALGDALLEALSPDALVARLKAHRTEASTLRWFSLIYWQGLKTHDGKTLIKDIFSDEQLDSLHAQAETTWASAILQRH